MGPKLRPTKGRNNVRVFEEKMLRRVFGPKSKEVTGDWRRLHNEDVHIYCASPNA
jgi:hypothetical protein